MSVNVHPLRPADRGAWEILARAFRNSHAPQTNDAEYAATWNRLVAQKEFFGLGAFADDRLLGIAHYFFYVGVWAQKVCYLQNLFTVPEARGKGIGRSLVEAVAAQALILGADRYFWLTHEHHHAARSLYDKVAKNVGFIRYEYDLRSGMHHRTPLQKEADAGPCARSETALVSRS